MYDLLILTFNEKKHKRIQSKKIYTKPLNKFGKKRKKYYYELWPFINNCYGILYKLFTKEGFGKFECCDDMFTFGNVDLFPGGLETLLSFEENECNGDWITIKLDETYKEEFVYLVNKLIFSSPIHTIAFLCRGQSFDKEVIVGTMSCEEFTRKILSGNIRTNVCYIVRN